MRCENIHTFTQPNKKKKKTKKKKKRGGEGKKRDKLQLLGQIGGGRVLTWGRRVPEAADKIAVYRVKVFLFELF